MNWVAATDPFNIPTTPHAEVPGTQSLAELIAGLTTMALIILAGAFVVGVTLMAAGRRGANWQATETGKATAIASLVGIALIGGAPQILRFFHDLGVGLH